MNIIQFKYFSVNNIDHSTNLVVESRMTTSIEPRWWSMSILRRLLVSLERDGIIHRRPGHHGLGVGGVTQGGVVCLLLRSVHGRGWSTHYSAHLGQGRARQQFLQNIDVIIYHFDFQ